jgi:hypothetical protein
MTLYAFASTHGAPGVTTTVLGLAAAWRDATGRAVLVLEADPDGGVLAARFDDLRADRTLADVAVEGRRQFEMETVLSSAQSLWGGLPVVVAPPSAEQSSSALGASAERLAAGLAAADDLDVLVDLGRLTTRSPALPFARRAVTTVLVARPTFESVASMTTRVGELRSRGCQVCVATIGDQPYRPHDVGAAVDAPLLASLPDDSRAAATFVGTGGGERRLRRSLLWRTLADLATRLVVHVPTPVELDLRTAPDAQLRDIDGAVVDA